MEKENFTIKILFFTFDRIQSLRPFKFLNNVAWDTTLNLY